MTIWTQFECPTCHEPFQYGPTEKITKQIAEMELKIGRTCMILIECPHCPETLIVNRETGRTRKFEKVADNPGDMGGLIWDMTLTEKGKDEVQRLLTEGDQFATSNPKKAEQIFLKAIAIRKHDPHAWYNVGVCRHRLGDLPGAEEAYRHVLQFDPSIVQAWNNLASSLVEQNRLEEGDECFDRGIAVDPENPKLYLGKGNIAAMRGDFADARKYMNIALEKDPGYQRAREAIDKISIMEKMYKTNWIKNRIDKLRGK